MASRLVVLWWRKTHTDAYDWCSSAVGGIGRRSRTSCTPSNGLSCNMSSLDHVSTPLFPLIPFLSLPIVLIVCPRRPGLLVVVSDTDKLFFCIFTPIFFSKKFPRSVRLERRALPYPRIPPRTDQLQHSSQHRPQLSLHSFIVAPEVGESSVPIDLVRDLIIQSIHGRP